MKKNSHIDVKVTDGESFISGVYISNIKNKESPKWLKNRLELIGIRCICAIVDVTNYIMVSFGQPMHAYDAKKINNSLVIRKADNGEKFIGLDSKEYLLNNNISVISDNENIHAIAGIIGGKHSECTLTTTDVFLESSWFNPISIAKSSKHLKIYTDSSYRFARSVDREFIIDGLNLAIQMILELCGGEVSNIVRAGSLNKSITKVNFNYQDINKFGNIPVSVNETCNILEKLGFNINKKTKHNWSVKVPSWRSDITMSADLIEEVVRIYGYDKIKEDPLIGDFKIEANTHDDLRILMTSRGFHEVFTWSFMSELIAEKFGYSDKLFIIDNPFNNHLNIMRPSIIPNLLQITSNNIAHGAFNLAIFEIGPIYNSPNQPNYVLSGIRSGSNLPRNHYNTDRKIDVFDAKSDIISALKLFNINCDNLTINRADKKYYYHPGKSGVLSFKGKIVGYFGELHPSILDFFNIKQKVVGFELLLKHIKNLPLSKEKFINNKYQSVERDFAFIVNKDVAVGNIINIVKKSSRLITEVLVFDIYHGNGLEPNKISIALSVTLCSPTHTLTQKEIQRESSAIISSVYKNAGGTLR